MKLANLSNLHIYFFYFFLFSIPFQTRKVFLTEYSFYSGAFTEWTTFFVYASDIFLILALFFWLISVLRSYLLDKENKNSFTEKMGYTQGRSSLIAYLRRKVSSHLSFLQRQKSSITTLSKTWLFLAAFLAWIILSLVINNVYLEISVFQAFKIIELSLLVLFVYFNLKSGKNSVFSSCLSFFSKYFSRSNVPLLQFFTKKIKLNKGKEKSLRILYTSLIVVALSGFLQSLIAIYQFIVQRSVFTSPILAKITGESNIGPQISGVAKIVVDGEKIIRAYGTFPHPNILGGFLIFTLLITIYLYLEHKRSILSSKLDLISPTSLSENLDMNTSEVQYNNTNSIKSQGIASSLLWITVIFAQTTALFFTFSRTAWVGFLLSLFIIIIFHFYSRKNVSRETIEENFLFNEGVLKEDLVFSKQINFWLKRFFNRLGIQKKFLLFKIRRFLDLNITSVEITDKNVSSVYSADKCETFLEKNNSIKNAIIKFKELSATILLLIILIISNLFVVQARFDDNLISNNAELPDNSAISDRSFYNNVSRETICENFVLGSGLGTYIFQIDGYLEKNNIEQELQPWQYQPAHNIYFLIASEIGIIGLLFFLLFVMYAISDLIRNISNVSRETFSGTRKLNYFLLAIFISFLFIGLFDHYFWTLQQGRLIFWLILGMMMAINSITLEENRD